MKNKKGIWKLIIGVLFGVSGAVSLANGTKGSFASFLICFIFVFWWSYPYSKKSAKANITLPADNVKDNSPVIERREITTEVFFARGVDYYLGNVKKLACCNPDWKKNRVTLKSEEKFLEKIYRYNYIHKPVKLIEEPTNEYDENAVQIIIAGELVGYIPAESALHVKDILNNHEIKYISSFISGGEYKIAYENGIDKSEETIRVKVKIAYI